MTRPTPTTGRFGGGADRVLGRCPTDTRVQTLVQRGGVVPTRSRLPLSFRTPSGTSKDILSAVTRAGCILRLTTLYSQSSTDEVQKGIAVLLWLGRTGPHGAKWVYDVLVLETFHGCKFDENRIKEVGFGTGFSRDVDFSWCTQ